MKKLISKIITMPVIVAPFLGISACSQANKSFILQNLEYDKSDMTYFIGQQKDDATKKMYAVNKKADKIRQVEAYFVFDGDVSQTRHKESISPKFLYQISPEYYFLGFNDKPLKKGTHVETPNYLVDRITGECFPFPIYSVPLFDLNQYRTHYDGYWMNFPQDQYGNIYFVASELDEYGNIYHPLNKLNLLNPNKLTINRISLENESVDGSFGVDANGNCVYSTKDDNGNYVYRCISNKGVIFTNKIKGSSEFFSCLDGQIYMCTTDIEYQNTVCCITFDEIVNQTQIVKSKKLGLAEGLVYAGLGTFSHVLTFTNGKAFSEPIVLAVGHATDWQNYWVLQIYNGSEVETKQPLKGFEWRMDSLFPLVCETNEAFYLFGIEKGEKEQCTTFCECDPVAGPTAGESLLNEEYHCDKIYDLVVDYDGTSVPHYKKPWLTYSIHNPDGTSSIACLNIYFTHNIFPNIFVDNIINLTDCYTKEI